MWMPDVLSLSTTIWWGNMLRRQVGSAECQSTTAVHCHNEIHFFCRLMIVSTTCQRLWVANHHNLAYPICSCGVLQRNWTVNILNLKIDSLLWISSVSWYVVTSGCWRCLRQCRSDSCRKRLTICVGYDCTQASLRSGVASILNVRDALQWMVYASFCISWWGTQMWIIQVQAAALQGQWALQWQFWGIIISGEWTHVDRGIPMGVWK